MGEDSTMTKFGKVLRRSTGDLFELQVDTYVSCSKCLMFDNAQVIQVGERVIHYQPIYTRPVKRAMCIGLYKNANVGSFLVVYETESDERKTPRNIIWLKKGCIVSKDEGNHHSVTLHCSEMGDVECRFECSKESKEWYKSIRSELNNHHNNNINNVARHRNNADQIFTIEKQGCLRRCRKRSSAEKVRLAADLSEMFIGTTSF